MTDENGWPERLILSEHHQNEIVNYMQEDDPDVDSVEYVRADLTQAAVAAALEEAADKVKGGGFQGFYDPTRTNCSMQVRDLISTTGTEALDRIKEQVRAEERERCARIAEDFAEPGLYQAMPPDFRKGYEIAQPEIAAAIRGDSYD